MSSSDTELLAPERTALDAQIGGSSAYTISTTFPGTGGATTGPYLIPPSISGDSTQPWNIWIAGVCAAGTTPSTQGIGSTTPQPDFSLVFKNALMPITGNPVYALVSVQPGNLFTDSRAALQNSFRLFRQQVEQLEQSGVLIAGGTDLLLAQVAGNLPLRFDEVLFYHYGLDPVNQYVDLQPGMTLRLEAAGYQYCDGPGGPGYGLNAYVNAGSSRLPLVQLANGLRAFDAFLGRFSSSYSLNPAASCPLQASGLVDLQVSGNARKRWRLVYPAVFVGAGSVDNQGAGGQTSCVLLGADSYADLDAATTDVIAGNAGCGQQAQGHNPIVSISFTGRTIAVPEITVLLRNQQIQLPVGSTYRNVIQQMANPAPTQFLDPSGFSTSLSCSLWRWVQAATPATQQGSNPFGQASCAFTATPVAAPYGDEWDIPLLRGDFLWWKEQQAPTS